MLEKPCNVVLAFTSMQESGYVDDPGYPGDAANSGGPTPRTAGRNIATAHYR